MPPRTNDVLEEEVRNCFLGIEPRALGLTRRSEIKTVKRLELGQANLNFLVATGQRRYVFRINMHPPSRSKLGEEYRILTDLGHIGIAPRAFYIDESDQPFGAPFSILEYVEGTPLSSLESDGITHGSVRKLARLVAKVHSLKREDIGFEPRSRGTSYEGWIGHFRRQLEYIRENRERRSLDSGFDQLLKRSVANLTRKLPRSPSPRVATPCHGDVGAQNIIVDENGDLHLIDWEFFALWDPAVEISVIFEAFGVGFPTEHQEPFLQEYSRIRDDETIRERIRVLRPLVRFEQLTWGISHVFEILNGEMDKAFTDSTDISTHLAYVDSYLEKCIETGLIQLSPGAVKDLEIFSGRRV